MKIVADLSFEVTTDASGGGPHPNPTTGRVRADGSDVTVEFSQTPSLAGKGHATGRPTRRSDPRRPGPDRPPHRPVRPAAARRPRRPCTLVAGPGDGQPPHPDRVRRAGPALAAGAPAVPGRAPAPARAARRAEPHRPPPPAARRSAGAAPVDPPPPLSRRDAKEARVRRVLSPRTGPSSGVRSPWSGASPPYPMGAVLPSSRRPPTWRSEALPVDASPDAHADRAARRRAPSAQLFWASQVKPMAAVPPWVSLVVSVRTL